MPPERRLATPEPRNLHPLPAPASCRASCRPPPPPAISPGRWIFMSTWSARARAARAAGCGWVPGTGRWRRSCCGTSGWTGMRSTGISTRSTSRTCSGCCGNLRSAARCCWRTMKYMTATGGSSKGLARSMFRMTGCWPSPGSIRNSCLPFPSTPRDRTRSTNWTAALNRGRRRGGAVIKKPGQTTRGWLNGPGNFR